MLELQKLHRHPVSGPAPLLRDVYGTVLRRERRRQHRTLDDVATRAGVSIQYLSEIERGLKEASSEILAAVCASLGSGLAAFLAAAHRELAASERRPVLDLTRPVPQNPLTSAVLESGVGSELDSGAERGLGTELGPGLEPEPRAELGPGVGPDLAALSPSSILIAA